MSECVRWVSRITVACVRHNHDTYIRVRLGGLMTVVSQVSEDLAALAVDCLCAHVNFDGVDDVAPVGSRWHAL